MAARSERRAVAAADCNPSRPHARDVEPRQRDVTAAIHLAAQPREAHDAEPLDLVKERSCFSQSCLKMARNSPDLGQGRIFVYTWTLVQFWRRKPIPRLLPSEIPSQTKSSEIVILFGLARRTANKSEKVSRFYWLRPCTAGPAPRSSAALRPVRANASEAT